MKRVGTYLVQKGGGEAYKAYVPVALPPQPLQMDALLPALERAMVALTTLNNKTHAIPNTTLFTYMYVRREALLSSQIEGTQSSFSDLILFENNHKPVVTVDDVEEVSNYIKAINHGLTRLAEGFPLSLRLLREVHAILLEGTRGATQTPGEFRRSQNWIGGTRPGNALFVPPPPELLGQLLGDFEQFLHDQKLPVLIKAGLAHLQFETIHPFLDGNGRLGRLLMTLMLCESGLLDAPVLYLSLYLKQNRQMYYALLQEVRTHGAWETWLEFFLEGVAHSANAAVQTTARLTALFEQDMEKIQNLGRARFSCMDVFEFVKKCPQISVLAVSEGLGVTSPTARAALERMTALGILVEASGKKRDKVYVYQQYLNILEEGAEPL